MLRYDPVSRITTIIAAIISILVAIAIPAAYFTISYQYKAGSMDAEAALAIMKVEGLVMANPAMWRFEEIRLQELLQQRHRSELQSAWMIRDNRGNIIAQVLEPLDPPVISRQNKIFDAGTPVASIEISQSLVPLRNNTVVLSIFSCALGFIIYFVLRTLPLEALRQSYRSLEEKEQELLKTERYQRALINNFPFMVWLKDTEGRFLSVNEQVAQSLGARDADALQGKRDFDLTSSDLAECNQAAERAVMLSRSQMIVEEEVDIQGVHRWIETYRAPVLDADGELLGTVGFSRDITGRKDSERENIRIEKLESLGVLAGGIAHDFNNLLTGIMGNISFARMFLDPAHKSFNLLTEAEKASVRASELARQLLTFSRGGEPVKKIVSLQHLLSEAVSLMLRGSNVRAVVNIPDSIHAVEADEGQISQAFNNIIINATQAMPGGGTLTINAENETLPETNSLALLPGAYVRILFSDDGCGIPEKDLMRIFDPYFSTKMSGNGLGLASTYSIVKRHGGYIGVRSIVNKGTTFNIYLPSVGEAHSKQQADIAPQIAVNHGGGSVLVMDDEEIIRELAGEMLTYLGYQVTTCVNGEEAISCYKTARESGAPFSAVIMDLTIPGGMGGREAAERILAIDPEAFLIVSSGYSNDPIMADHKAYGFNGAVAKPYNVTELEKVMSSLRQGNNTNPEI